MTNSIIDDKEIRVLNEDETEIRFRFRLEQAGDVCTMLISAADSANNSQQLKRVDHYVSALLTAQAEMIEQGLHVRDHRAPQFLLDIEAFHQKFGLEYNGKPRMLEPELFEFRKRFMHEELDEWAEEQPMLIEALTENDGQPEHRRISLGLNQQLDALVDLLYVVFGTAYLQFGVDVVHEAWRRVQAANMAKVRCEKEGDSKRGSTFDVIKPEGWEPPDHHDLVKDNAHKPYRHGDEINEAHLAPESIGPSQ